MHFADIESEKYYHEKIGQIPNLDSYIKSLIYILSNNKDTRVHFSEFAQQIRFTFLMIYMDI